ncbi:MAG TPA: trehalose-6-phosphate synthase, partial [Actinomycetota bacterium]|nr:trehalose-6-phosphate synthase [Actinomycetota bacterium]
MTASTPSPKPAVLIASNRGPVSFGRTESGGVVATRGVGGLVTALSGAVEASDGLWIASALTEEDRLQAERGRMEVAVDGRSFRVRYLRFDPDDFQRFYNAVSNRILWFLHHYLWDLARTPRFGPGARVAWDAYRRVNRTFAETLAEEGASSTGASYLVQDYHLALVPAMLRELEPNARIAYFSHVPFAGPGYFGILPEDLRTELLRGLLGADVVGFHSDRWAENFLLNCRRVPDARVDLHRRTVLCGTRTIRIRVYPIAVDAPALREAARSPAVIAARAELAGELGDQRLILRVDRVE